MPFWFARARQLVQRLRRARPVRVGGVGGRERRAAERGIHEPVQQAVVAAVGLDRGVGHGRLVGRGGLRGLAGGRVEQVVRHRVVALVLVDQGEITRGLAGLAVLAGTGGRDLQRAAGDLGVGHPVEVGRVALRGLVNERVAEGVDAVALAHARAHQRQRVAVEPDAEDDLRTRRDRRRRRRHGRGGALVDHQRVVDLELAVRRQDRGVDEHALGPAVAQVQPSPRTQGEASPWAVSGLAGTDTVQFIEAAA